VLTGASPAINTGAGIGTVTLTGTLNDEGGARDLTVTAGIGNILVTGTVGNSGAAARPDSLTLSGTTVEFQDTVNIAANLTAIATTVNLGNGAGDTVNTVGFLTSNGGTTNQFDTVTVGTNLSQVGAWNLNDNNLTVVGNIGGAGTLTAAAAGAGDVITVGGNFVPGAFSPENSSVIFNTAVAASVGSYTFNDLTINKGALGNTVTATGSWTVTNSLTLTQGTWIAGGFTHLIAGNWDSSAVNFALTEAGSTIQLSTNNPSITTKGAADPFDNLTLNDAGNLLSNIALTGNLLIIAGIFNSSSFDITINGNWTNSGGTFTHNNNTVTFAGSGTISSNASPFFDVVVSGATYSLSDNMEIDNSLTTSGTFQPGNHRITLNGSTWDTTGGTFDHSIAAGANSLVLLTNANITITGNNTFYRFDYQVPGGTILFGNGDTQSFINDFIVIGALGNLITLNSDDILLSWNIDIDLPSVGGTATAIIEYVDVRNSNAINAITPDTTCTDGGGNTNWFFFIAIIVSWTEDLDENGRIDRIRVRVDNTALPDLTDSSDTIGGTGFAPGYSDVDAFVDGYDLDPTTPFSDSDTPITSEFFINLVEKEYTDTDITPQWRLTNNTSLKNKSGGALVEAGLFVTLETPLDNAAPVANYTLSSAEKDKIFLQFSEYVRQTGGADIGAGNFTYAGTASITDLNGITTTGPSGSGAMKEIELTLDGPVSVDEILAGALLNINMTFDDNFDWELLATYPTADQTALPGIFNNPMLSIPNFQHRVSDLALGLTGDGIIQPVFATDEAETDANRGGIGLIKDFTGSEWLQDQVIELTTHVNNGYSSASLSDPDVQIQFDVDISTDYRQNNATDGLWLPSTYDVLDFYGIVPSANPDDRTISMGASPSANLRTHTFDPTDPELKSVSHVEFLYYLPASNLFAARIENSSASDWYRGIKPWSFDIHDISSQVGGVTILNNVINPENGETANLHYELTSEGMVTIQVFDISGAMVDILNRGRLDAGDYSTSWDGRNSGGRVVARGVYFIRIVAPGIDETRKVMVVK
jgi:fibronectin-binding autotransporter adhesin